MLTVKSRCLNSAITANLTKNDTSLIRDKRPIRQWFQVDDDHLSTVAKMAHWPAGVGPFPMESAHSVRLNF